MVCFKSQSCTLVSICNQASEPAEVEKVERGLERAGVLVGCGNVRAGSIGEESL
jgi:hypothetical protein